MSYEEFWEKDYRLVESYVKKNDMDIERETANNWELVQYIRMSLLEIVGKLYRDKKKGGKPYEFPQKPEPRTFLGIKRKERNQKIDNERRYYYQMKMLKARKDEKSDGND